MLSYLIGKIKISSLVRFLPIIKKRKLYLRTNKIQRGTFFVLFLVFHQIWHFVLVLIISNKYSLKDFNVNYKILYSGSFNKIFGNLFREASSIFLRDGSYVITHTFVTSGKWWRRKKGAPRDNRGGLILVLVEIALRSSEVNCTTKFELLHIWYIWSKILVCFLINRKH